MSNPQAEINKIMGKAILFVVPRGANGRAVTWTTQQHVNCALRAKSFGYDNICVRVAEGTRKDYTNITEVMNAVNNAGMGWSPFVYDYGPRFGMSFINKEAEVWKDILAQVAKARGDKPFLMLDNEIEYDFRPDAAQRLADVIKPLDAYMMLTTWGNPTQHGWHRNIDILRPYINQWVPQEYNDYLAHATNDDMFNVQPALDLSDEFTSNSVKNHPVTIAQEYKNRGAYCFYQWEWSLIGANRDRVKWINGIAHS